MSNHYYTENPDAAHDFEQWSFELRGKKFHFVTDSGVFSVTRWTMARGVDRCV